MNVPNPQVCDRARTRPQTRNSNAKRQTPNPQVCGRAGARRGAAPRVWRGWERGGRMLGRGPGTGGRGILGPTPPRIHPGKLFFKHFVILFTIYTHFVVPFIMQQHAERVGAWKQNAGSRPGARGRGILNIRMLCYCSYDPVV